VHFGFCIICSLDNRYMSFLKRQRFLIIILCLTSIGSLPLTYTIVELIRIGQIFLLLVYQKRFGRSIAWTISMTSSPEEEETLKHPFDNELTTQKTTNY